MSHTGRCNTPDGHHIPCSDVNCEFYTEEPDRCIALDIVGIGHFDMNIERAQQAYVQLGNQLREHGVI